MLRTPANPARVHSHAQAATTKMAAPVKKMTPPTAAQAVKSATAPSFQTERHFHARREPAPWNPARAATIKMGMPAKMMTLPTAAQAVKNATAPSFQMALHSRVLRVHAR